MRLIPVLLIVAIVLLLFAEGSTVSSLTGTGIASRDPARRYFWLWLRYSLRNYGLW